LSRKYLAGQGNNIAIFTVLFAIFSKSEVFIALSHHKRSEILPFFSFENLALKKTNVLFPLDKERLFVLYYHHPLRKDASLWND